MRDPGNEVGDVLRCCHGQLSTFPEVTTSSSTVSRALPRVTSKGGKLPIETEPVASNKPKLNMQTWPHQTFTAPYSIANRSNSHTVIVQVRIVLKRTVVGDCRFDNLSGSHPQSQEV